MAISGSSAYLGVDIGTSSIKLVELKKMSGKVVLSTYGFSDKIIDLNFAGGRFDIKKTASILKNICEKANISTNMAVCSLSTFSVFSSIINVNAQLNAKDMDMAVNWEAKKVIPIPIEDVVLFWQRIDDNVKNTKFAKVLLIGAPANLVRDYVEIFKTAQLSLLSLETEVFSLIRSLLSQETALTMLVQLGSSTTNIFIIDQGIPILSRSIDVGGGVITRNLSKSLNIGLAEAEQFKLDLISKTAEGQNFQMPKVVLDSINPIINEIKYILEIYLNKENREIKKIVLTGGGAMLGGLVDLLSSRLNVDVIIGDPWFRVAHPAELKPVLDQLGPRLSVAIGLAMEKFDKH